MTDNPNNLEEWTEIRELLIEDIPQYLQVLANLTEVKTDLEIAKDGI